MGSKKAANGSERWFEEVKTDGVLTVVMDRFVEEFGRKPQSEQEFTAYLMAPLFDDEDSLIQ